MAKPEERKRARELRQQGWAIHEIAKELQMRKDTIRKWVRDIALTEEIKALMSQRNPHWEAQQKGGQTNKVKAYEKRMAFQDMGRQQAQEGSELHLMACILYWAEGAKSRNNLRFINTDPYMLKLFMRFLREEMQVEDGLVSLQVFHHTSEEDEIIRIRQYWIDWLELPQDTHVNMRSQGWAYSEIVKELGVSKASVSNWCSDIVLTEAQEQAIKQRQLQKSLQNNKGPETNKLLALEKRREYQELGRQKARERRRLHIIGCMLHWAEGSKYIRYKMDFANSDPVMQQVFIRFLREELLVADELIRIKLHCHTQDESEIARIKQYWLDLLQLPEINIERVNYKEGSDKRINRLANGVCSIVVYRVEIIQHIYGAIQEYAGFVNEEWLY